MLLLTIETGQIIILALQAFFVIALLILGFRLARYLYAKLRKLMTANGISTLSAVLALGIAALVFYSMFSELVIKVGNFVGSVITQAADALTETETEGVEQLSSSFLKSFQQDILSLPFASIILFIALWVFVSLLVENVIQGDSSDSSSNVRGIIKSGQWRYFIFAVLIISGIFLSVASIIAVPILKEDEESNNVENIQSFEKELTKFINDSSAFYNKFSIRLDSAQKANLDLATVNNAENWNDIVSSTYSYLYQYKDQAIGRYSSALEEKISADAKNDFSRELIEWFLGNKSTLMYNLNLNLAELKNSINRVFQARNQPGDSTAIVESAASASEKNRFSQILISINDKYQQIPEVPKISAGYGVFGWLAGPVLNTNSIQLALITGMFGFGLFGATISRIIQDEGSGNTQTTLLASDFLTLVLKGISAALVIFLAAQGGLLVVSGAQASLNSYIIFFFCFVAAVFSDVVWEWVKTKLSNTLNNSNS